MDHDGVPGQLQHQRGDPQPPSAGIEQVQPAPRLDGLPLGGAPVEHAAQDVGLCGVGGLLEALAHARLALGADLRVEALLVLAEAVEAPLALGVVGVVGVGQVLGERGAQQVLVLEAGGAEDAVGAGAGRARGRREGARAGEGVLARGGLLVGGDGGVGDVAILVEVVGGIARGTLEAAGVRVVESRRLAAAVEARQVAVAMKAPHRGVGVGVAMHTMQQCYLFEGAGCVVGSAVSSVGLFCCLGDAQILGSGILPGGRVFQALQRFLGCSAAEHTGGTGESPARGVAHGPFLGCKSRGYSVFCIL